MLMNRQHPASQSARLAAGKNHHLENLAVFKVVSKCAL
jgi:hypothetical protein